MTGLRKLLQEVRSCRVCEKHLPLGPKPILRASISSRILIVGQAPGTRVHKTGIPWNDPSGDRLRVWMNIERNTFYDEKGIAIIPTGFCYPGRGKSGDLSPRPECAPLWHPRLLRELKRVELILLIGQYAQAYYLADRRKGTLTETVRAWREYSPRFIPIPHPSPRNQLWLKRNPWFTKEVIPELRRRVHAICDG